MVVSVSWKISLVPLVIKYIQKYKHMQLQPLAISKMMFHVIIHSIDTTISFIQNQSILIYSMEFIDHSCNNSFKNLFHIIDVCKHILTFFNIHDTSMILLYISCNLTINHSFLSKDLFYP